MMAPNDAAAMPPRYRKCERCRMRSADVMRDEVLGKDVCHGCWTMWTAEAKSGNQDLER